jgi:hypothetical protein
MTGRDCYPYRVRIAVPAAGLRERYGRLLSIAKGVAGDDWDAWEERAPTQGFLMIGFAAMDHAAAFRAEVVGKGWTDLLA